MPLLFGKWGAGCNAEDGVPARHLAPKQDLLCPILLSLCSRAGQDNSHHRVGAEVTGAIRALAGPRRSGRAAGGALPEARCPHCHLWDLGPTSLAGVLLPLHGGKRGPGRHRCENQPLRLPPKVKGTCFATFRWDQHPSTLHVGHLSHFQ